MYYLIYGLLYLVSLLPFFLLYILSDFAFFILYHIAGYRKKIVEKNLEIAFPEKSVDERKEIMVKFYRNLTDTFIETIKLLSISRAQLEKRARVDDSVLLRLQEKGLAVQVFSGHQMNWEYAHLAVSRNLSVPWIGIYMHINNAATNRLFLKIRSRFNAVMISAGDFSARIREYYGSPYMLALIADQNPGIPKNAYWLNFFGKPAPFPAGPEKGAMKNKTAVVFINFVKIKRGYYEFIPHLITENAATLNDGELTRQYRDFLETSIRNQPDNYLWSHRRWKVPYDQSYSKRWIDTVSSPVI